MALPHMGKKKRKKKTVLEKLTGKKKTSKPTKKTNGDKRSESLGGALVNNLVVKPAKTAALLAGGAVVKDIPELALLSTALRDFVADIIGVFDKKKIKDTNQNSSLEANFTMNAKMLQSVSDSVKNINQSIVKQSSILSSSFGALDTKLDVLDNIFAEIRSLTSITAKVWDVSKRSLASTRSTNLTEVMKQKAARFQKENENTKNKSFDDLQKEEKPLTTEPEKKKDSFLDTLSNIGSGIMGVVEKLISGSGLGKLLAMAPAALLSTIAASMGWREIQQVLKTDFSKIGDKFTEVLDKKGILAAMQAVITDDQVKALGMALMKGFQDIFDPLVKGIMSILPKPVADTLTKGADMVEGAIGRTYAKAVGGVSDEDSRNQENELRKAKGKSPISDMEWNKKQEDMLDSYVPKDKEHQNRLAWSKYDIKKNQSKTSLESFSDFMFGNDNGLVEQKRKEQGLAPIQSNRSRQMAERNKEAQDNAMRVDAAKDVAIMNSGGKSGSSSSPSTSSNSTTNNTTIINNSGGDTRSDWYKSYTEKQIKP